MNDGLTILLCDNSTGDCKVKPLLVCSYLPRALEKRFISCRVNCLLCGRQIIWLGLLDNFSMSGYMQCSPMDKAI